jgi:hypothetical protein
MRNAPDRTRFLLLPLVLYVQVAEPRWAVTEVLDDLYEPAHIASWIDEPQPGTADPQRATRRPLAISVALR